MKKQLVVGILFVLTSILVITRTNYKEKQTLSPVQFEKITGEKAENNIGTVPYSEEMIIKMKLEIIKKKQEEERKKQEEERKKQEALRKAKEAEERKKKQSNNQVKQTYVSYNKSELQQYAHNLVINYGWSEYDFECLVNLWNRESGWSPNAVNKKSGACGIPQSLPCNKMASHGSDYRTNGKTQIRWGLDYIKNRYGSPSQAWAHSQQKGWY